MSFNILLKKPDEMFVRQAYLMRHSLPDFCQTLLKLCILVNQNLIIISSIKHKFLQLVLNKFE